MSKSAQVVRLTCGNAAQWAAGVRTRCSRSRLWPLDCDGSSASAWRANRVTGRLAPSDRSSAVRTVGRAHGRTSARSDERTVGRAHGRTSASCWLLCGVFSEEFSRDLVAVEGSCGSGVRLEMYEQLDDLALGDTIVERYA